MVINCKNIVEVISVMNKIGRIKSIYVEMSLSQANRIEKMSKIKHKDMGFTRVENGLWAKYGIPVVIKPRTKKIILHIEELSIREIQEQQRIPKKWYQFWK